MKTTIRWAGVAIAVLLVAVILMLPGYLERVTNTIVPHEPYEISQAAAELHKELFVADLHSDTLLWHRSVLRRSARGHVDVPRLRDGNVALQIFPAVTKSPSGMNYDQNTGDTDQITQLVIAQRWPIRTWGSLLERALYQSEKLHRAAERYPRELTVVKSADDIVRLLTARVAGEQVVGGLLAIEGLHALEGDVENVQTLYDAGFRMMGLHHFFDNRLGGSLHGVSNAGLTPFGAEVVARMDALSIIIDLAHSSEAVVEDVLRLTRRPVVISHTGVKGACNSARNIQDALMRRIARRGGLIGIGYWDGAVCDPSPESVVRSIRYAIDLLGADHVALGSDYDGATAMAFDTSEVAVLTEEMLKAGFTQEEIRKVMGDNVALFLSKFLPAS